MDPNQSTPFYEAFPFLKENTRLSSDYSGARVVSPSVSQVHKSLEFTLIVEKPVPPFEISILEDAIAKGCGYKSVTIEPACVSTNRQTHNTHRTPARNETDASGQSRSVKPSASPFTPILGRAIKAGATPMSDVTIDLGKVTVKGEVINVRSRRIEKNNSWLVNFDITDYTGSINVTKFMRDEKAAKVATLGKHHNT